MVPVVRIFSWMKNFRRRYKEKVSMPLLRTSKEIIDLRSVMKLII